MGNNQEFAPGIPDKGRFEPIPVVSETEKWKSVVHRHDAFKAGRHLDLRLQEPGTDNLHSWAVRRLPKPGEKVLAVQQPTHAAHYGTFKGVIPSGYGAGSVRIQSKGEAKVHKAGPGKITFQMGPSLYTLVKTKKDERSWLLVNHTKIASVGGTGGVVNDVMALAFARMLKGSPFQRMVDLIRKGKP